METLRGELVTLRPATHDDIAALVAIRRAPEVFDRWPDDDLPTEVADAIDDPDLHSMVIELGGRVAGMIQWSEEHDPMYRHAGIDLFVDPGLHGRGVGTDAVRTLATHLLRHVGHHRLVIDPAADNAAAIRCYAKVGFRPVGVMRRYERGADGSWHDGLLMDLLADDLVGPDRSGAQQPDP